MRFPHDKGRYEGSTAAEIARPLSARLSHRVDEFGARAVAPSRSLLSTRGSGWKRIDPRSQISAAPLSPQSSNLRVGPQLPFHVVTAGPEDDASGAAGLELGETFAQLLARACESHLFGGGHVDERVMAVG